MSKKQMSYQELVREEYKKCLQSPIYFMKKYVKIQHPIRGTIFFGLYPFQEETLQSFHDYSFNVILKSRQMGISTLVSAYSLWLMIFNKDKNILIISLKQDVAKEIITKVRFANDNLPTWLKVKCVEDNRLSLKLSNGSQIRATSTTKKSGVSLALSLLIIDEAALIDEAEELWTSAQPTLSCLDKTAVVLTDGGLIRLESLINDSTKLGFNDIDLNVETGDGVVPSTSFYSSPKSDLYEIKMKSGGRLVVTEEHPLMTQSGWKSINELEESKDGILCKYNQQLYGPAIDYSEFNPKIRKDAVRIKVERNDISYLAGLWVAEGNYQKSGICITNIDEDIIKFVSDIGFKLIDDRHNCINSSWLKKLLQWIGCEGTSHTKRVPVRILSSSFDEQRWFLRGLFDGDGCSLKSKGIKLTSVSYELVSNVKSMLLNMGIYSYIREVTWDSRKSTVIKDKSKLYHGFELYIGGWDAHLFYNTIGFNLQRKQNGQSALSSKSIKRIFPDKFTVKSLILESGLSIRKFSQKHNCFFDRYLWYKGGGLSITSVETLLRECNKNSIHYSKIKEQYYKDTHEFYDEVVSISYLKNDFSYDLKVPTAERFIANGYVNHNTGGRAIILSTPRGVGNWFHKLWQGAEENNDGKIGKNGFHPILLPWDLHPDRTPEWRRVEGEKIGSPKKAAQEFDCFDADTRIYTETGLKKISDLKIGDLVLTHTNEYKRVIGKKCGLSNKIYEISSYNNKLKRYTTSNHPFLLPHNKWISAEDAVKKNTRLLKSCPSNIQYNWKPKEKLDLYELIDPLHFKKVLTKTSDKFYINDRRWKSQHNRFLDIDYDIGFFIGMYMAEGSKGKNAIYFSFDYAKEFDTWPEKIKKIVNDKFGIDKSQKRKMKDSYSTGSLYFCSSIIHSFLSLLVDGKDCYTKKLSEFCWSIMTKEFARGILDGVMRGDGCLTNSANKSLSSTSLELIYQIKFISSILGFSLSSIKKISAEYKSKHSGKMISDRESNCNYADGYQLSFYNTKNIAIKDEFSEVLDLIDITNYNYKNSICLQDDYVISKPTFSKKTKEILTYNIEVEGDHSYITEHFTVHNCDFLASGDNVIELKIIEWYKKERQKEPVEVRGIDHGLWIWQYPDYTRSYIVCLPSGESVLTSGGIKKIEDVTYNDNLIDKLGNITKIEDIKTRKYDGKIYEITPSNTFRTTKFTDEHPIYVSKNSTVNRMYMKDDEKYEFNQRYWEHDFQFVDAKSVSVGDWIRYPNIYKNDIKPDITKYWEDVIDIGRTDFRIQSNLLMNNEFWWFVGMWLAEGWCYTDKHGNITIYTAHNITEKTIVSRIEHLVSSLFNRTPVITRCESDNSVKCQFGSKQIGMFLMKHFGKYAHGKFISESVKYALSDEQKKMLVIGYIGGDGCVLSTKTNGKNIKITSVSLKLLEDVQDILFSIGCVSGINLLRRKKSAVIKGQVVNQREAYSLNIHDFGCQFILDGHIPKSKTQRISDCYVDDKFIYFKVKRVKELKYKGLVHNFTTSTGTFLCRNITTHNCADVARGDGEDYSACHVLDAITLDQCAEYKGSLGTKDFGNFLVALSTEYNNALLVIERENVGWAAIQPALDRNYPNLFYSSTDLKYVDVQRQLRNRYDSEDKKLVPGFSTNMKTRPLVISHLEQYCREEFNNGNGVKLYSTRTLAELEVFIWKSGKAIAMDGYNDDLTMALGIGLWIRDTALRLRQEGVDLTKATMEHTDVKRSEIMPFTPGISNTAAQQSWRMSTGRNKYGQQSDEDISWLLG